MTSTSSCPILGLPVELLQSIAAAVPNPDSHLSTLRLVCKDFEAAVFDAWADLWLGYLYCFLLDPARLQKLSNITSRKHLVQRIRTVRFCLDPWELADCSEIHVATPCPWRPCPVDLDWEALHYGEQDCAFEAHQLDEYNRHYHPPDQALLASVLENLGQSCKVVLDLRVECSQRDETMLEKNRQEITSAILGGVPFPRVRELIIFNSDCTSEAFLKALQYMAPTIETIRLDGLALWSQSEEEIALGGRRWNAAFRIMLDCPKLESLHLEWLNEHSEVPGDLAESEDYDKDPCEAIYQLDCHEEIQQSLRLFIENPAMLFA